MKLLDNACIVVLFTTALFIGVIQPFFIGEYNGLHIFWDICLAAIILWFIANYTLHGKRRD